MEQMYFLFSCSSYLGTVVSTDCTKDHFVKLLFFFASFSPFFYLKEKIKKERLIFFWLIMGKQIGTLEILLGVCAPYIPFSVHWAHT